MGEGRRARTPLPPPHFPPRKSGGGEKFGEARGGKGGLPGPWSLSGVTGDSRLGHPRDSEEIHGGPRTWGPDGVLCAKCGVPGVSLRGPLWGSLWAGFGVPDLFSPMATGRSISPGGSRVWRGHRDPWTLGPLVGSPRGSGVTHGVPGRSHGDPGHLGPFYGHGEEVTSSCVPSALQGPCLGVWCLRLVLVVPGWGGLWGVPLTCPQPA